MCWCWKGWKGLSSFPRIMILKVVFQICFGSIKMMWMRGVLVLRSGQLSYSIYVSKWDSCVQQYFLVLSIFVTIIDLFMIWWQLNCLSIKMSVKQMKPFMTNVFLTAENKISDASCCILFKSCDWTESENVNFIKISYEKWFFLNFDNKAEFLINRSIQVECDLNQRK